MGCSGSKEDVQKTNVVDYHAMFKEADKDKKGTISQEELFQYLTKKGYNVERETVERTIKAFDDNQNGQMDENEFVDFMTRLLDNK